MSNAQKFIEYIEQYVHLEAMPEDVKNYFNQLKENAELEEQKPLFTEIGLQILEYLQQNQEAKNLKAKDIADGMVLSSRQVSGAIRKLVTDGYVDKGGQNPVVYNLTTKGQEFNINEYKENRN